MVSQSFHTRRAFPQSGISLIEVLISMGILAFGLLGVAALFPVGGHYMQKGDTYDRADAVAQAALNDAVTRGLLNPRRWMWHTRSGVASVHQSWFTDNLQQSLGEPIQSVNQKSGFAYVIDPVGIGVAENPATKQVAHRMTYFPAGKNWLSQFTDNETSLTMPSWQPWAGSLNWPLRRITVSTSPQSPMSPSSVVAEQWALASDDLAVELSDRADQPGQQRWVVSSVAGAPLPMNRQAQGNYSWFLTVVPTTLTARDALAVGGRGESYDVSAVVVNKRFVGGAYDLGAPFRGHDLASLNERVARAAVLTDGVGGGEIRLYTRELNRSFPLEWNEVHDAEARAYENLKPGNWLLLFGPHVNSVATNPILFCQWFRVLSIEAETDYDGDNVPDATVALRGPDWPWRPRGTPNDDGSLDGFIQNDLRAIIVPGVVAVHTRTLRLDSGTAWSAE